MDAISKIHELLRFGSVLGLERMNNLLSKLGNPEKDLKVIHVAGTNGKGSVCRYMYESLLAEGYSVGLYTSPFLEVFNERIEANGKYISDDELEVLTDKVFDKIKEMTDEGLESPTEFEAVTAMAFLYFKEKAVDFVVLEVGLGGRGDSTNVIESPLASVITSISYDHTDRLGSTLTEIAGEKAGIIKKNVPVISGTEGLDALDVFMRKSSELNAPLYRAGKIKPIILNQSLDETTFKVIIEGEEHTITIGMLGKHQIENAICALYTLIILRKDKKIQISDEAINRGFRKAKQIGRFEIMEKDPYVIIDGAHNIEGALALKTTVNTFFKDKKILMVVGILRDKDSSLLDNFIDITKDFLVTEPPNPRKLDCNILSDILREKGCRCIDFKDPHDAVKYSKNIKDKYDLILYAGSLYLIGEIRGLL